VVVRSAAAQLAGNGAAIGASIQRQSASAVIAGDGTISVPVINQIWTGAAGLNGAGVVDGHPSFLPSATRTDFGGSGTLVATAHVAPPGLPWNSYEMGFAEPRPPGGTATGLPRRYSGLAKV